MKRIIRIAGFSLALILLFLAAVAFTATWLKRQNNQLLGDAIQSRSAQFAEIIELTKAGPPPWSEDFTRKLGQALGAEIVVSTTQPALAYPAATTDSARWRFDHVFRDTEGNVLGYAQVRLVPPPTVRAMAMLQRVSALLLSFALLLVLSLVLLVILDRRWLSGTDNAPSGDTGTAGAPADYGVLSHLAERSARQSIELEQEREERLRVAADAHLKQILLNRALQEKIDMGRDLHDGLIQSLYATGLTIQAGRKAVDHDPAEARAQIDTALHTLNAAIREVRSYISGLGPQQLRQRNFSDSIAAVVSALSSGRELATDLRIDEDASHQLNSEQVTDLLQIIREAVSNSLRHGQAKQIAVRLHRNGTELCLLVHDDGRGFDPASAARGHGLDNMQARADRLGARLSCQSEPGRGTRLVLTFNAPVTPVSS